jgi:hypothetical protein
MARVHVGAAWYFVFAGAKRDDRGADSSPGLRVFRLIGDQYSEVGFYPAALAKSAVRVLRLDGAVLGPRTDDGVDLTFDVNTLSYR